MGVLQRGTRKLFEALGKFTISIVGMVSRVYIYLKTYKIVHFKYVQLIMYQLYLN